MEITKIFTLQEPAVLFAEGFETNDIIVSNYKYLDIALSSGAGNVGSSVITIEGKNGEGGESSKISFYKRNEEGSQLTPISEDGDAFAMGGEVGKTGRCIYRVVTSEVNNKKIDRIKLKGTAFASWSGVQTSIVVIAYNLRYTE